ncbi:hypothetical protein MNBD_ALPHA04-398 [hydrothermal vent metagenome]|uniref:HIG1 domain-containing protein n=1 Tax=hydrothermal vent metagenome TaxID=652676 RepID=A0A3B0RW03_9ZZZZ
MSILLILLILIAAGAVVFALVRGLIAFANMDPDDVDSNGVTASHKRQNEMMFARIKYQAIAVVLVIILLAVSGGNS